MRFSPNFYRRRRIALKRPYHSTDCQHTYCGRCLYDWWSSSRTTTCPSCRNVCENVPAQDRTSGLLVSLIPKESIEPGEDVNPGEDVELGEDDELGDDPELGEDLELGEDPELGEDLEPGEIVRPFDPISFVGLMSDIQEEAVEERAEEAMWVDTYHGTPENPVDLTSVWD